MGFQPEAIICEGESHFFGYLQAMAYRSFFNRRVALLHWCFIALPGEPPKRRDLAALIKACFRRQFDAFVVYSSYSKARLIALGRDENQIFVAHNIGNVKRFQEQSAAVTKSRNQLHYALGIPRKFTVLYAGTLDANKRPEVLLELAARLPRDEYNFLIIGGGTLQSSLAERVRVERLSNVHLLGRVEQELVLYYLISDVLLVPGRGGIVISEALATGLPAIVHQADGTEYDLIQDGVTGYRVEEGSVQEYGKAIERLRMDPVGHHRMRLKCLQLMRECFNESKSAGVMRHAAQFAISSAQGRQSGSISASCQG